MAPTPIVHDASHDATNSMLADDSPPSISGNITVPANAAYRAGQTLDFTVTFTEDVIITGTSSMLVMDVGGAARSATYHTHSSTSITYRYTVQPGDSDSNGIQVTNIVLNGSTIRDAAGNDAIFWLAGHLPSTAGILIDTTAPAVATVAVPFNAVYGAGQNLDFTVNFDENVQVTGSDSTLSLTVGDATRSAVFLSSSGNTVTYRYIVQAGDRDANGIVVGALNTGSSTIRDAAGNPADLTLQGVGVTTGVIVDGTVPSISGTIAVPDDGSYPEGQVLHFTVTFDENVIVTGTASTLTLTIGSAPRSATYESKTANSITYTYTVQAGDNDADGIAINGIALNGGTIRDAVGNNADLSLAGHLPSTAGILIDTVAPVVSGDIGVPADGLYGLGQTLSFTVTFDEEVAVTGTDSALGLSIGGTLREAAYADKTANAIIYTYTLQAGDNAADGIALGAITRNTTAITDLAGNAAVLSLDGAVPALDGIRVDTDAPIFTGATVNGRTLVMTYSDTAELDAVHAPPVSAFAVMAGGRSVTVSSVAIDAAAHTVTLTLATTVTFGQVVSVAYADPTPDDDVHAIQDAAGNDAASLPGTAVTNHTPAPVPPPTQTTLIDGVPVVSSTAVRSDGTVVQVLTVPIVTPSRQDQGGDRARADIPLVKHAAGDTLLLAQVPVGFGLEASGVQPQLPSLSLKHLIREITAHTADGSATQQAMTGGGQAFVEELAADSLLLVQTIVVMGEGDGSGMPLVLSSQLQSDESVRTALVIDTRGSANSSPIELQNVAFAAIIGEATVTGGNGAQVVWGDDADQTFILGAGNDTLYGGDGDDLIVGGEGDDYLDGGQGHDTAGFSGRADDYSLRFQDGVLVITDKAGNDGTDTVAAVETLRFAGGQGTGTDAVLARLYEGLLQRPASAAEVAFWEDQHAKGASMHDVAAAILASAEAGQPGNLGGVIDDAAFVASLYESVLGRAGDASGTAFWLAAMADGTDRASVALSFVNAVEKLSASYDLDFNHSDPAVLVRMYHAMFGRAPDEAGLNFWLGAREQGMSMGAIADTFAASDEARSLQQQTGDVGFIDHLCHTALNREASGAEKALLLAQLQQGVYDYGQVLLNVAESAESIALVGNVNTSLSFV
ncbi:DUF4214 domain-containing protein [Achromobacter sp. GG226]|uniref:DUF4214 domain-containing protein n=1 Tax=Verticiella alkaliphila TaxID=2779529 RepID=UPI001C0DA2A4|nr:DUF4214 domain-containing protein [Verticiella sp. GG226]MBU4610203.1 DUF4214 domain-containing protein [Verticiella sp. GG226]